MSPPPALPQWPKRVSAPLVLVKSGICPTRENGGTNISCYKHWQHLKLWTFVPLRLHDTPLGAKRRPFDRALWRGRETRAQLGAPPPANRNWRRGPNSSRNTHISAAGRRHLAEGVGMKWHGWSTAQTRTPISRFGVRSVFHPWLGDLASLPTFPGVAKNSDGLSF